MICVRVFGLTLAVDFTAPALLALLSLMLPQTALLRTLAACLLHECAHLLAMALTGQKPAMLRLSAAGMLLHMRAPALCPAGVFAAILCAGPAANLLAAGLLYLCGSPESAAANLSLALFNLLPCRSTDGGSLLYTLLEHRFIRTNPELPAKLLRILFLLTAGALAWAMHLAGIRNPSLRGMLLFMLAAELTGS